VDYVLINFFFFSAFVLYIVGDSSVHIDKVVINALLLFLTVFFFFFKSFHVI